LYRRDINTAYEPYENLDILFAPALEELRTGGDECIHKHGAVLAGAAPCRLDAIVNLVPIFAVGWMM
jgi:hypothetical protein